MEKYEAGLPVIRRKGKAVSEPLLVSTDFGADNLQAEDYQAAGKVILEYRVRLLAANSAGEQIGCETRLKLERPESLQLAESKSPLGGACEAPPSRDDPSHPADNTFAQRMAELNRKLVQQLAGLRETSECMRDASEQVARAITPLHQGLGEIKAKLEPFKSGDESKS